MSENAKSFQYADDEGETLVIWAKVAINATDW